MSAMHCIGMDKKPIDKSDLLMVIGQLHLGFYHLPIMCESQANLPNVSAFFRSIMHINDFDLLFQCHFVKLASNVVTTLTIT